MVIHAVNITGLGPDYVPGFILKLAINSSSLFINSIPDDIFPWDTDYGLRKIIKGYS